LVFCKPSINLTLIKLNITLVIFDIIRELKQLFFLEQINNDIWNRSYKYQFITCWILEQVANYIKNNDFKMLINYNVFISIKNIRNDINYIIYL